MNQTTNYELKQYEGSDTFNPLQVDVPNLTTIDATMHENAINSVPKATHILSGTVHAIVRDNPDAAMFVFVATADFTFGDSFTGCTIQCFFLVYSQSCAVITTM